MTMTEVEEFLAHHGVKGMRWGHRKEEDSAGSSSSSKQDRRETAAKKFDAKAASSQQAIDILKSRTAKTALGQRAINSDINELTKQKVSALKDAEAKRNGKLTSTQKKVIAGAAITAAIVGGAVVYNGVQSGEFNRLAAKGSALVKGQKVAFTKNSKLADVKDVDGVFEHVVKGVNPGYGKPGTKLNCRRATFAYELRRRGYDVRATRTTGSTGQTAAGLHNAINPGRKEERTSAFAQSAKIFIPSSKQTAADKTVVGLIDKMGSNSIASLKVGKYDIVQPKSIFDSLSQQPDGSRGELAVRWLGGGAHSLAYEIFGGKPVVFDTQSGEKYDTAEKMASGLGFVAKAGFSRLDNIDLNENFLNKWVKNVK